MAEWERIYTVTSFFAGASDDLTYYEYLPAIEAAYGKEPELVAMEEGVLAEWERIYTVTSFFAGASDDLTYYEYLPAIEAAYGKEPELGVLVGNSEGWETFRSVTAQMKTPAINSIPTVDDENPDTKSTEENKGFRFMGQRSEGWETFRSVTAQMKTPAINSIPTVDDENPDTKSTEENKGFRFMGQRFTIDAAIFQKLIYENVQEDSEGNKRMLPDTLDVAAALGSDTAYSILEKQGDTDYAGYKENMEVLRTGIKNSPETLWSASLYSNWLYTLKPLLEEKGDGYPDFMQSEEWAKKNLESFAGSYAELKHDTVLYAKQVMAEMGGGDLDGYPDFMQSEEWAKKNLESFAGSYAELKHDTVLYAKQVMAEMGGGDLPQWDDRGYVEPEVQVWSRFTRLAARTRDGLKSFGLLSSEDEENLNRLEQMASQFLTMSEKELKNQLLSDEEYELIRNYGGNLEHFWLEAFKDEGENINSGDFPAAIVTDIATDPNGACLEVGTGNPSRIYVIVPIDGELHICVGAVYSFYQFEQPISERLTDSEWRQMMGISAMDNGTYNHDSAIEQPKWTNSYRYEYKY